MTLGFVIVTGKLSDHAKFKTTLIEYIEADGVAEAFNKAAERKHEIIVSVGKAEAKLWEEKAWGRRSNTISVSIDAVVAKPKLEKEMIGWYYVDPKGNVTLRKIWTKFTKHITIPKNKLNDPDVHCPSPV